MASSSTTPSLAMLNERILAKEHSQARRFWVQTHHLGMLVLYTPFFVCLAAGTLDMEVFRQYASQDVHLTRAFAHACELAEEFADDDEDKAAIFKMRKNMGGDTKAKKLIYEELWGVDHNEEIAPSPATVKFTKFLLATAQGKIEGSKGFIKIETPFEKTKIPAYIFGATASSMKFYEALGGQLGIFLQRVGEGHPYKKWIDYYSSIGYEESTVKMEELLNKLCIAFTSEDLEVVGKICQKATKLSTAFFSSQPVVQPTVVPLTRPQDPANHFFIFSDFDLTCTVTDSSAILAEIAILKAPLKAGGMEADKLIPQKAEDNEAGKSIPPKTEGTEVEIAILKATLKAGGMEADKSIPQKAEDNEAGKSNPPKTEGTEAEIAILKASLKTGGTEADKSIPRKADNNAASKSILPKTEGTEADKSIPPKDGVTETDRLIPPKTDCTKANNPIPQGTETDNLIPPKADSTEVDNPIPRKDRDTETGKLISPKADSTEAGNPNPRNDGGTETDKLIPPKADSTKAENRIPPKADGTEADKLISRTDMQKAWTVISEQYPAEYEHCLNSLCPEGVTKFNYEALYNDLEKVSNFEKQANSRVIESGLLTGIKLDKIKKAGEHIILQDGCADFFWNAVNMKNQLNTELHILSYCWCADLIRSSFSSVGCLDGLTIHSNEFIYENSVATGEFSRNIQSPKDKLKTFKNILNTNCSNTKHLSVYIGDTVGDLLCLLNADVGIVINPSSSLRTLGQKYGVAFLPLGTNLVKKQKRLERGSRIWKRCGVIFTVCTWSEITAFILGTKFLHCP